MEILPLLAVSESRTPELTYFLLPEARSPFKKKPSSSSLTSQPVCISSSYTQVFTTSLLNKENKPAERKMSSNVCVISEQEAMANAPAELSWSTVINELLQRRNVSSEISVEEKKNRALRQQALKTTRKSATPNIWADALLKMMQEKKGELASEGASTH